MANALFSPLVATAPRNNRCSVIEAGTEVLANSCYSADESLAVSCATNKYNWDEKYTAKKTKQKKT